MSFLLKVSGKNTRKLKEFVCDTTLIANAKTGASDRTQTAGIMF